MARPVYAILSVASLLVCLAVPFLFLQQTLTDQAYKAVLLAASVVWFVSATASVSRVGRRQ